jgi:hypothetical protein
MEDQDINRMCRENVMFLNRNILPPYSKMLQVSLLKKRP